MAHEKKYQIDTSENKDFLNRNAQSLLSFGHKFPSPGGGAYWLGDDGTPWKDRNRETWITARMAHVYSLGVLLGHEGSAALADSALHGLMDGELHDKVNGGWYPGVHADGSYMPDKQCYAHAFVMLAASSGMLAGRPGAEELLKDAEDVFLTHFWDEENGLTYDTWNTEFTVCDSYRGLNANMHSVEAFLAVADVTGDEVWRERAGRVINRVLGWAEGNNWRIPEHYTDQWVPDLECNADKPDDQFKPYGATPGHGIEWARLITQWALSTYKNDRDKATPYIKKAESLFNRAVEDGWDSDGAPGIVYTTDWSGKPVVHDRMHWTIAEAINTSSTLYHVTGKPAYAEKFSDFLAYTDDFVVDHKNGSWFHQLDRSNKPLDTVWPGKCDLYHATQSMLICQCQPDVSIAKALYDKKQ